MYMCIMLCSKVPGFKRPQIILKHIQRYLQEIKGLLKKHEKRKSYITLKTKMQQGCGTPHHVDTMAPASDAAARPQN